MKGFSTIARRVSQHTFWLPRKSVLIVGIAISIVLTANAQGVDQNLASIFAGLDFRINSALGPKSPKSRLVDHSLLLDGNGSIEALGKRKHATADLTIEAWFKPISGGHRQGILQIGGESGRVRIGMSNAGNLECYLSDGLFENSIATDKAVSINDWHYLYVTLASGELRIFVDGISWLEQDLAHKYLISGEKVTIGAVDENSSRHSFRGLIDEIRIAEFVNPIRRGYGDKLSVGSTLNDTYVGIWRFEDNGFKNYSSNAEEVKIVGNVYLDSEVSEVASNNFAVLPAFCGTTQVENAVCRDFDDRETWIPATNTYSDVSFSSTPPNTFYTDPLGDTGYSHPNVIYGFSNWPQTNFFAPLIMQFAAPVDNLTFRVLGINVFGQYAFVRIYQQNGTITDGYLDGYGYDVPVDYGIGLATCGGSPCNQVIRLDIFGITDPYGLDYDNVSYTPSSTNPSPTPTPTPSPTPTVSKPSEFTARPDIGEVKLTWQPGASGADSYRVYKTVNGSDVLLTQVFTGSPLEFSDWDVEIRSSRPYKVLAIKNGNTSEPATSPAVAPISPCAQYRNPTNSPSGSFPGNNYGWMGKFSGKYVTNVRLNNRMLASYMNAAEYIYLKTNRMAAPQRINLYLDENDPQVENGGFISKGIGGWGASWAHALALDGNYCVSSASGQAAWLFNLKYVFSPTVPNDQCEPSASLECTRFYPLARYLYVSKTKFGELPESVQVAQRLLYRESDKPNTVGLYQDCENVFYLGAPGGDYNGDHNCSGLRFPISMRLSPLKTETYAKVISNGTKTNKWDNIHTTSKFEVSEPGILNAALAGCPSCVHDHWRWSGSESYLNFFARGNVRQFRLGQPLIGWDYYWRVPMATYRVPNQDVEIGVIKTGVIPQGAEARSLANGERIYAINPNRASPARESSEFWYVATSKEPYAVEDGYITQTDIIHAHGGFFNPNQNQAPVTQLISLNGLKGESRTSARAVQSPSVDGPTSVQYEWVYEDGKPEFSTFDATGTTLPPGYSTLNTTGYDVATTATVSGTQTVTFTVQSISSSETFANLRVLHGEFDEFNPGAIRWVDRTVLAPDPQGPNFPTRTISSRGDHLGRFILALLDPNAPQATTDLKIEIGDSPDPVRSDTNLVYTFTVTNISTQNATMAELLVSLPGKVSVSSISTSQGSCAVYGDEDRVYCQLGNFAPTGVVTGVVTAQPREGEEIYPPAGAPISTIVSVRSAERDVDATNNTTEAITTVLPSLNLRPVISIVSPSSDSTIVSPILAPTDIQVSAVAVDADGSIGRVQVFDNGEALGDAALVDGQFRISLVHPSYGYHIIVARATDNGGSSTTSEPVRILVNGLATIMITQPPDLLLPGGTYVVETTSNLASSRIQKIQLFANGKKLGEMRQASVGPNLYKYRFNWQNLPAGKYDLVAALNEYSGSVSQSTPVSYVVSTPPSIAVNSPVDGNSYVQPSVLPINLQVSDVDGYVDQVDIYANGIFIGSASPNTSSGSTIFDWQNPPDGIYSLVAVATDDLGIKTSSNPVSFGINRPAPARGELIWVDDQAPSFSTVAGNDGWNWVNTNPNSLLGSHAHQSLLLNGHHEHYFVDAPQKLPLSEGDQISAWIFIDKDFPPSEVMLQFFDGQSWEHRAYWGDNLINLGTDGTPSRLRIGDVPPWGGWRHLRIPASSLGLVGKQLSGMAFTLFNGRAAWDRVGKLSSTWTQPGSSPNFVWIDDAPPAGALLETHHDTWTDGTWISSDPLPHSLTLSHRNWIQDQNEKYRQRSFKNPINSMVVEPGDTLFMYVYLYPISTYRPDTLVVQWYDDIKGWAHRAYWGIDARYEITAPLPDSGTNTEGWRYMGAIPAGGNWVRLEVPASYVGLEGKTVKGMAFGIYQKAMNGRAVWDDAGKTSAGLTTQVPDLTATTPIYRFKCGTGTQERLKYTTNKDHNFFDFRPCTAGINSGFAYGYPAPGAAGIWAWRDPNDRYYLSSCAGNCGYPGSWVNETLVAWAPNSNMTDTVPYKFRICSQSNWYFSSFPNLPETSDPASGCGSFGVVEGYVHTH
jgi:hypothetical protein